MGTTIENLLKHPAIWRLKDKVSSNNGEETGYPKLNAELPDGGWPLGSLTELLCNQTGIGEISLLMPVFKRFSQEGRNIVLISPPYLPFARALEANDIRLERLVVVESSKDNFAWVTERIIKAKSCGIVVAWDIAHTNYAQLRRLHLSAENSNALCMLYRSLNALQAPSPAPLRLALKASTHGLEVQIAKRKGALMAKSISLPMFPPDWVPLEESLQRPIANDARQLASKPTVRQTVQ